MPSSEITRDALFERAVDAAFESLKGFPPQFRAEVAAALRAAEAVYAAAEKEFVDDQVAQANILGWRMDAGVTDLQVGMAMETAAGLVSAAKTFLTATGAENYVEQHVHDRETGERYTLTIQRPGKKTPHQLRREAEAERDKAMDEWRAAVDHAARIERELSRQRDDRARNEARLVNAFESLILDTDGSDAEVPVGEIRRVFHEATTATRPNPSDRAGGA